MALAGVQVLTPANIKALRNIYSFARDRHLWPSLTELAKRLRITHQSAHHHVKLLKAENLVALHAAGWCSYWHLTPQGFAFLAVPYVTITFNPPSRRIRNNNGKRANYYAAKNLTHRLRGAALDSHHAEDQFDTVE